MVRRKQLADVTCRLCPGRPRDIGVSLHRCAWRGGVHGKKEHRGVSCLNGDEVPSNTEDTLYTHAIIFTSIQTYPITPRGVPQDTALGPPLPLPYINVVVKITSRG